MQLQTTSPERKFPNEYSDIIFIQIDQHLKNKYCKNTKGSRFSESRCSLRLSIGRGHHRRGITSIEAAVWTGTPSTLVVGLPLRGPPRRSSCRGTVLPRTEYWSLAVLRPPRSRQVARSRPTTVYRLNASPGALEFTRLPGQLAPR